MRKKATSIPVRSLSKKNDLGITIDAFGAHLHTDEQQHESGFPHRHDAHIFALQTSGTTVFEIDFKKYRSKQSSIMYLHPDQVHRLVKYDKAAFYLLEIGAESIYPEYLKLLEEIKPAAPLLVKAGTFAVLTEMAALCVKLFKGNRDKLYRSLVKSSCNTLVALVIAQYVEHSKTNNPASRAEVIAKAFKQELERNFLTIKRPADYAKRLNISAAYLNECVNTATGYAVSFHIQQRIILEAKRLLFHSDKSVKEIAAALGYEDHAYFSRLFTKATGTTALAFRSKNRD